MKLRRGSILMFLSVPLIAIGLAACGGSSNNNSGGSSTAAGTAVAQTTASTDTVSTKSVSGVGTVLVDSKGDVLYTNNQDSASKVACTGAVHEHLATADGALGRPAELIRLGRPGEARRHQRTGHLRRQAPVHVRAGQPRPGDR